MLAAAAAFGHPQGWRPDRPKRRERQRARTRVRERFPEAARGRVLDALRPEHRAAVAAILQARRRIPEEILGPDELRRAWSTRRTSA